MLPPGMPGSGWLPCLILLGLSAGPSFLVRAVFVNRCRTPNVCNFVCDCWDCSDENQCGYQKDSEVLGTPFTCDFEGSSCGWEDVSTTAYQWTPARASILTWGAEPPFDHTRGTDQGWYLITTKQRVKPSATARLQSPLMQEAAATCEVRAWYHLWGPGLNDTHSPTLTVELTHGNHTVTLWRNPPSSVYPWRELVTYTGQIQGTFQITFSVTQAFSETVQLALDDVAFRNCGFSPSQPCGPDETPCKHGGCIANDRWCDGTRDCKDGLDEANCDAFSFCSFENGWCNWQEELKDFSWVRNSSLQVAPNHAWPTRDHSTNTRAGYFVFVNNGPLALHGGKAWLVSPFLKSNGSCYLVLYIHLHDSDTNSLNIYYQTAENVTQLVRSRTGDLDDYWFREKVDFNLAEEEFRILIEGVIGTGRKGNIALDDLILSPGCVESARAFPVTSELGTPSLCSPDQFACDNETCISAELACDFKADCSDGSDEHRCGATTFADDAGGWMDVSVGRLEWTVQRNNSRLNAAGSFFSLQEAPGQMLSLAKAATPVLGPSGLACALEMDFTIGPQGLLILAIADERLGTHRWVWYELGVGTTAWKQATVPLGARDRPFQLELLALDSLEGSGEALLAIRNISFVNCDANASHALSSELSCNFERDWCAWFMEQDDGFEWERRTSHGSGVDHTTGKGSFLSADPLGPGPQGLSARLASSPQVLSDTTCLSFWYRMDGPQIGTLNLKVKRAGEQEQLLWTRRGSYGAVWHRGFSTIAAPQPGQRYQIIFEALRDGFLGAMALDDITVVPEACAAQKECSFEVDDCGLLVDKRDTWVRQNGAGGQGPSTDHTLGTPAGHYMIINTSSSALPAGQKVNLQSQVFLPLLHTHCVTFWYHLSGSDPGSLRAHVKEGNVQREMLSIGPVRGEVWHHGSFEVQVQREWQVLFVAESTGTSPSSYVALDDLHVKEGDCPRAGSCDFEMGTCGWSKPPGDWYSWDWKEGVTPSQSPSPKVDHTLGTKAGHYAYVDIAVLRMGRTVSRLVSEPLPATTGSCLHFYYHMNFRGQSSQAELKLKLSSLEGERRLWSATGDQGRTWRHHSLFVMSLTEFQIVLEASSGVWANSETIAVDDILYMAGTSCNATAEGGQEEGSSSGSGSVAGLVVGIVFSILLGLLGAIIGTYWLKKRRAAAGGMPETRSSSQGFDNITFRDDRVIIPPMPCDEEM